VGDSEAVALGLTGDTEALGDSEGVEKSGDALSLAVMDALAVALPVADSDPVAVAVPLSLAVTELEPVSDAVTDGEADAVAEPLPEPVAEGVSERDPLMLGEAERETDAEAEGDLEAVALPVTDLVSEEVMLVVGVSLDEAVELAVALSEEVTLQPRGGMGRGSAVGSDSHGRWRGLATGARHRRPPRAASSSARGWRRHRISPNCLRTRAPPRSLPLPLSASLTWESRSRTRRSWPSRRGTRLSCRRRDREGAGDRGQGGRGEVDSGATY
jgi:hypothetical protein